MRIVKLISALEGSSFEGRVEATLQSIIKSNVDKHIVKLNIYTNSTDQNSFNEEFEAIKDGIKASFKKKIPAFSIIYQPNCNSSEFTIQYHLYETEAIDVQYKSLLKHPYVTVKSESGLEVFSGAIEFNEDTLLFSAQRCFDFSEQILMAEDLNFGHIYRQWNYIPDLKGISNFDQSKRGNLNIFNEIQDLFFEETLMINGKPLINNINNSNSSLCIDFNAFIENSDDTNLKLDQNKLDNIPELRTKLIYTDKNEIWFSCIPDQKSPSSDIEQQTIQILKTIFSLKDICNTDINSIDHLKYIKVSINEVEHCNKIEELIRGLLPDVEILIVSSENYHDDIQIEIEGMIYC